MKTYLALLLILLPVAASHAADKDTSAENHDQAATLDPAKALAEEIGGITNSSTLTLKEKDDQVAAAVQNTISEAIAHLTDPSEILKATLELATTAAKAAPQFTHAILEGISTIPAISAINGAIDQIKAAVVDAATKAAAAAFDSDHDRDRNGHDHDDCYHIVSPSH
jgi:hypothetical protein